MTLNLTPKQCICVGCENNVVDSLPVWLNQNQHAMLGFFCKRCIKEQCKGSHYDRQQLRNGHANQMRENVLLFPRFGHPAKEYESES